MPETKKTRKKKFSGFAIAGFVLSFFGITSVLGIIFCSIGLSQTKDKKKRGRGLSIAGLIIGIVSLLLLILFPSFWTLL